MNRVLYSLICTIVGFALAAICVVMISLVYYYMPQMLQSVISSGIVFFLLTWGLVYLTSMLDD